MSGPDRTKALSRIARARLCIRRGEFLPVGEGQLSTGPGIAPGWRPFQGEPRGSVLASFYERGPEDPPGVPIAAVPAPGLTDAQLALLAPEPRNELRNELRALAPEQCTVIRARALAGEPVLALALEYALEPNRVMAIRDVPQFLIPE